MQTASPPETAITRLRDQFPELAEAISADRGETTVEVPRERIVEVATWLRDEPGLRFRHLSDLSGTDYPSREDRLTIDYHLYSFELNARVRLKVRVTVADPHIPTVTGVWSGANWPEREAYDMFGVRFDGHPGLVRILMPEDWHGHPQRKDYPLGGVDVPYIGAHIPPPDKRSYRGGWTST